MRIAAVRTCVAFALLGIAFAVIPPYIKVCQRKDPQIQKCIVNSIDALRDKLRDGIPELDVPPIEPLTLPTLQLLNGPAGVRFNINLTDVQVYGCSTFKIRNLKFDAKNIAFTYNILFEQLHFKGKYKINARILLLQLVGNGDVTGTFGDYNGGVYMKANKVIRDNNTYINFEKMKFNINIGNAKLNLTNLFNGDPILGPATNEVLNANSVLYIEEIKPVLQSALADLFTDVANKITKSFTYDELFPEN